MFQPTPRPHFRPRPHPRPRPHQVDQLHIEVLRLREAPHTPSAAGSTIHSPHSIHGSTRLPPTAPSPLPSPSSPPHHPHHPTITRASLHASDPPTRTTIPNSTSTPTPAALPSCSPPTRPRPGHVAGCLCSYEPRAAAGAEPQRAGPITPGGAKASRGGVQPSREPLHSSEAPSTPESIGEISRLEGLLERAVNACIQLPPAERTSFIGNYVLAVEMGLPPPSPHLAATPSPLPSADRSADPSADRSADPSQWELDSSELEHLAAELSRAVNAANSAVVRGVGLEVGASPAQLLAGELLEPPQPPTPQQLTDSDSEPGGTEPDDAQIAISEATDAQIATSEATDAQISISEATDVRVESAGLARGLSEPRLEPRHDELGLGDAQQRSGSSGILAPRAPPVHGLAPNEPSSREPRGGSAEIAISASEDVSRESLQPPKPTLYAGSPLDMV